MRHKIVKGIDTVCDIIDIVYLMYIYMYSSMIHIFVIGIYLYFWKKTVVMCN